ncbi:hypothetical protein HQ945_21765 [Phyllobacterium sp. BT25]|uniref:Uncharacterized protein n=1 Tax=Phyllobacterium pellucidum TaxID=2740464 RepID=A0A849VV96_9HYPH|nr:hypothetical protein [Phyllobacterium pellucidum]NTS33891.1 hypothetical protein [Phyllobacterium pellucidum]
MSNENPQNDSHSPLEAVLALETGIQPETPKTPVGVSIESLVDTLSDQELEALSDLIPGLELYVIQSHPELFKRITAGWSEEQKAAGLERLREQEKAYKASVYEDLDRLERAQPTGEADCSMIEQQILVIDPQQVKP